LFGNRETRGSTQGGRKGSQKPQEAVQGQALEGEEGETPFCKNDAKKKKKHESHACVCKRDEKPRDVRGNEEERGSVKEHTHTDTPRLN
jgi:hypothetical protein